MIRRLFAALLLTVLTAGPVLAAEPFTAAQKAALDSQIKDFIMANPQILISSVESYYNKQNQQKEAQEGPLKDFPAGLLDYPNTPSVGPKDAKVTVVEFFDYNCGYCKQVVNDVQRLTDEDKTVRVVFKDLPILSDTSETAARYALAANKQGKYMPYHVALLEHQGPITEDFLIATAKTVGLDADKLKKDANTQDVRDVLSKNVDLARTLGVRGTPFFVIGKQKVPGAVGYSRLKEIIAQEGGTAVAPAAAATTDTTTPATETKTDTGAPAPAADASAAPATSDSSVDPETQKAIDKARSEAQAMIDEIKAEATKMQAQAVEAQKTATDAAKADAAKAKK